MAEIYLRVQQTLRLKRDAFVWMSLAERATADAVMIVTAIGVAIHLGIAFQAEVPLSRIAAIVGDGLIASLTHWLVVAVLLWVVTTKLMGGSGDVKFYARAAGFAYPTLLLTIFIFALRLPVGAGALMSSVWFIVTLGRATEYASGLARQRAMLSVLLAVVGWVVVSGALGLSVY